MISTRSPAPSRSRPPAGPTTAPAGCSPTWRPRSGVAVSPSGRRLLRRRRPGHGAGDRDGSRVPVSRFGRRTFLASSAGVAAGAAAAGGAARRRLPKRPRRGGTAGRDGRAVTLARPAVRCGPAGSRSTALTDPVGVDPDGCSFAWTLQAPGRGPWPRRPTASWCGAPTPPGPGSCGTAVPCASARQAFVAYGGPALAADAAYQWTVQPRRAAGRWGPVSAPGPLHHRRCATRTGRPSGCARPAPRRSPTA